MSSASGMLPAIPTMSLGHGAAGHSMKTKLEAAAKAGFKGIEIFYACLDSFSLTVEGATPRDKLREAARQTRKMCDDLGLTVLVLQPLINYDGIVDPKEHSERVEDTVFRFELCKILGTDMIQIPSNFRLDDGVTGDVNKIVADIQEIADLGLKESPPIRFVYEAMCWSTFNYTWQQGWDIVQKVDRPNVGAVLDAFHIGGWEFADPTVEGGERPDGATRVKKSLEELVKTVPGDRVFYIQLVDAERLDIPLAPLGSKEGSKSPYYLEGQQPRMSWSRNCRLFPYETERGAYMPIEEIFLAFKEIGFKGWVSFELFNRYINDSDPKIPQDHAERGWKSWETLKKNCKL
ncbi:sugar phosphate isomerase [Meredithblackwellia eburnea MCA 4105]